MIGYSKYNTIQTKPVNPDSGTPPIAKKIPKTDTIHGDLRVDDYFWLREKNNLEVMAYLEAENAYADALMSPTEGFQETLYEEMVSRIKETDLSVPYQLGNFWYYTRTEAGNQYLIYCRKENSLENREEILLDLNLLAEGHRYFDLSVYEVSDDGNWLAYATDVKGFREYTLFIKDLKTGQLLPNRVEKVDTAVWAADNQTVFCTTIDEAKRPYRLFRHVLESSENELVYEEKDALYRLFVHRSRDKAFIFASSESSTTTEVRYLPSDKPTAQSTVILPRETGHEYEVEHHDDSFYIRTNWKAKNFRIVKTPVNHPERENWKEFIPHQQDVFVEHAYFFAHHCVLAEREAGLQKLRIINFQTNESHRIEFPEPTYYLTAGLNPEFNAPAFRLTYQSLITPASVFDYDMTTRKQTLLKQTEVLGGYNPSLYTSERMVATAADGVRIPISLVYKKGIRRDGKSPLLLYGYGAYGLSLRPSFSSARLSLLDRGVVYAMAHVRGGSELGKEWQDQGKMMLKKNTFTDFISAAEHLITQRYTSSDKLLIQGASAGGLLIGAVVNMRPQLFKAALLEVPFVDVINTMLDESLPLTVGEYLEWGNPTDPEAYAYMKSYCPYTNIEAKEYPAMLVTTSFHDSQVMYWEPAKYVAKLRVTKTDNHPLLLKTNMDAGHFGASGRYDALRELAFDYAFFLSQLGITG